MTSLKKQAEALGIQINGRWSDDTIQKKIDEAKAAKSGGPQSDGTPKSDDKHVSPDHWPAQSAETSNQHGEEVEADTVAEAKNADGRTNEVDFVKNTGPGPGNPDQRHTDPDTLMKGKAVEQRPNVIAEPPLGDDGKKLRTEETPKIVNETVSAAGSREITSNILPDMNARPELVRRANEINVRVDPSWDDNRLRAEIQVALEGRADWQVKGAVPPKEYGKLDYDAATQQQKRNTSVTLTHDVWEDDGNGGTRRVVANSEEGRDYKTTKAAAQKLLDAGKAKRNDPLPG